MRVVPALRDLGGCRLDRARNILRQQPELRVRRRRSRLDETQRPQEFARHSEAAHREILYRALGLRAPQGLEGHLQLAHTVALGSEGSSHRDTPGMCRTAARIGREGRVRYDCDPNIPGDLLA
jgi:hypothetical protein